MARLTRNPNGTNYCEDCKCIVILFDDDTHECCECSDEYGPCEQHGEVIAQREGASTRTADDLAYVFLTDVLAIMENGPDIPADGSDMARRLAKLRAAVDHWSNDDLWDDNRGCRWLVLPDHDLSDPPAALMEDVSDAESVLADLGLAVYWEDGYVITRMNDDCPLLD